MGGTTAEVRTEDGQSEGWEGAWGQCYLQGGQFCHQDRGCQGFQSDPKREHRGVGGVGEEVRGGGGQEWRLG